MNIQRNEDKRFLSYIVGFALSLVCTLTAYYFVNAHVISGHVMYSHEFLYPAVLVLAFGQFIVQILLFLHVGRESAPYYKLLIFAATVLLFAIVVISSVWIMNHLNSNMMPNMDNTQTYLINQSG